MPANPYTPIRNPYEQSMTPGSGVSMISPFQYQVQSTEPTNAAPAQQQSYSGSSSGSPASYAPPPPPPERIGREGPAQQVGREGEINIPGVGALGELDAAGARAQAAVFGRAKDRAGQIARSALTGLRSALAERGVLGSGMESQATVDAAMQGAGLISDTSREEAIQEARRGERAREFQTSSLLQQRGQNISQRGQDLGQILGLRGQDITQRGQDISQRGQDVSLLGLRNAGGNYTGVEPVDPYAGYHTSEAGSYYGNPYQQPRRSY
jgi:protein involved in polysaccharide export with SLBB domain